MQEGPGVISNLLLRLQGLRNELGKKQTFESAVCKAQGLLKHEFSDDCPSAIMEAWVDLLQRCMTLLNTRFTSPAFWQAGYNLFTQAQGSTKNAELLLRLRGYVDACNNHLGDLASPSTGEGGEGGPGQRPRPPMLFEGQLTQVEESPVLPAAAAPASGLNPDDFLGDGNIDVDDRIIEEMERFMQMDVSMLESVLLASMDQEGPKGAPPASKRVVRALKREVLDEPRLEELGGKGVECSVCREELEVGDEVQVLPCNSAHVFHPPCLAPWLAAHNSCPVCRFELETDDDQYERKKEREQAEAEDRKGADNAVSHNEFMYI